MSSLMCSTLTNTVLPSQEVHGLKQKAIYAETFFLKVEEQLTSMKRPEVQVVLPLPFKSTPRIHRRDYQKLHSTSKKARSTNPSSSERSQVNAIYIINYFHLLHRSKTCKCMRRSSNHTWVILRINKLNSFFPLTMNVSTQTSLASAINERTRVNQRPKKEPNNSANIINTK